MEIQQVNSTVVPQALKAAGSPVIEIHSKEQFEQEIQNSSVPVVVDFYATWCGPCRRIAPLYDELAQTFEGKVKFLKVNVDEMRDIVDQYNIKAMPTFLFFDRNGNLNERMIGANAAQLQQIVNNLA